MTPTTPDKRAITAQDALNSCDVCGKNLSSPSSLKRHRTQLHGVGRSEMKPGGAAPSRAEHRSQSAEAAPKVDAIPATSAPPSTVTQKPFYKKKRWYLPAAAFAGLIVVGAVAPSQPAHRANSSATGAVDPLNAAAAQTAAANKAAAVRAAARNQAAAKAAAAQAAAKAAAAKVAAEKAAAVKAAAEKAAAAKAAAERAAAAKAAAEKAAAEKAAAGTISQQNAEAKAADYLAYTAFSRSGLIHQLEFEGFSAADATWGVDKQNADWNQEAAAKAREYLEYTAFSRSGLISQLEFDGFTSSQARYGADRVGL